MEQQLIPAPVRPDPSRAERHHYPVWFEINTRFGDQDPLGHVNNVAVAQLYEECRVRFAQPLLERATGAVHRLVLAAFSMHFLDEIHYPAPVEAGIGVAHIGWSSYLLGQVLYQGGRCVGLADSTMVHAPVTGISPLPDDFRAALESVRLA